MQYHCPYEWKNDKTWRVIHVHGKEQICIIYYIIHYFHKERVYPYSAGIDFSRQKLTSVDVRFWQLKSVSAR